MRGLLRWVVSALLGVGISLFIVITVREGMRDVDLVGTATRIFPLIASESEECREFFDSGATELEIAGTVGTYRGDPEDGGAGATFVPVEGAMILVERADGARVVARSNAEGAFDFVTEFSWGRRSSCDDAPPVVEEGAKVMRIEARECAQRRVPITSAWVPHRVILECPGPEGDGTASPDG